MIQLSPMAVIQIILIVTIPGLALGQSIHEYGGNPPELFEGSEPPSPLLKENPNELAFYYDQSDDCPGMSSNMVEMIEGLFTRSRLKTVPPFRSERDFHLVVLVECASGTRITYDVNIGFAQQVMIHTPRGQIKAEMIYRPFYYGAYGYVTASNSERENEQYLENGIRSGVEKALTDYLKANFDL